jgi:hypothetical protein
VVSGGPDAEGFVLDWAAVLTVDDANMDFGGLRVGEAGHDEERAEESEWGESAALVLDYGYEGVKHGGLSENIFDCMSAEGAGYTSLGRSPRKLGAKYAEG